MTDYNNTEAAKQQQSARWPSTLGTAPVYEYQAGTGDASQPAEPTIKGKTQELLSHLNRLAAEQYRIREKLLGPVPCSNDPIGKNAHEPCLQEMLHAACQLAAQLCGEAATISGRL